MDPLVVVLSLIVEGQGASRLEEALEDMAVWAASCQVAAIQGLLVQVGAQILMVVSLDHQVDHQAVSVSQGLIQTQRVAVGMLSNLENRYFQNYIFFNSSLMIKVVLFKWEPVITTNM